MAVVVDDEQYAHVDWQWMNRIGDLPLLYYHMPHHSNIEISIVDVPDQW